MTFQAIKFFFKENTEYPDTKTDLFKTTEILLDAEKGDLEKAKASTSNILIKTFDIKMPENDGYNVTIENFDTRMLDDSKDSMYTKDEDENIINVVLDKEYDIELPYLINIVFDATEKSPYVDCDIAIYGDITEESLIKNYKAYLKLGIIVIKDMVRYYSTNWISYRTIANIE